MKSILPFLLTIAFALFDCALSGTPTTLCRVDDCEIDSRGNSKCKYKVMLQIRGGYYGEISSKNGFALSKCSNDGIFCVQTSGGKKDIYLTYGNQLRHIGAGARHPEVRNTWCTRQKGIEYWFEV